MLYASGKGLLKITRFATPVCCVMVTANLLMPSVEHHLTSLQASPVIWRMSTSSSFGQFPLPLAILLRKNNLLYAAINSCDVGLLLNPPEDLIAPKNSSR